MKSVFWTLLLSCSVVSGVNGDTLDWTTEILSTPSSAPAVGENVMVSPGPNSNEAVAVWGAANTSAPYYAIYNGTWFSEGPIPLTVAGGVNSTGVNEDIFVTPGPVDGELVAAWNDRTAQTPYYSIYSGGVWTTGQIPLGTAEMVADNVTVASGPNSGEITVTWTDFAITGYPYYSIFDGSSWSTGVIDSISVLENVFVTQGPTPGTMLAAWGERVQNANPYYAIYSGGTWTTGVIPLGASSGVQNSVVVAQGPLSGQITAVWDNFRTREPYYSIYSEGTWSAGAAIPLGSSLGAEHSVFVSQGTNPGSLVATWSDFENAVPYYAVFEGGVWTPAAPFPLGTSTGSNWDVTVTQLMGGAGVIAAWANSEGFPLLTPYYSFTGSPAPLPPASGSGKKVKNQFPLMIQWYNQLTWAASGSPDVVGYNLRRNGTLIAERVTGTSYIDYNRSKHGVDVYTVNSVNNSGSESLSALQITVR